MSAIPNDIREKARDFYYRSVNNTSGDIAIANIAAALLAEREATEAADFIEQITSENSAAIEAAAIALHFESDCLPNTGEWPDSARETDKAFWRHYAETAVVAYCEALRRKLG